MTELLTRSQAAAKIGLSIRAFDEIVKAGRIPVQLIGPGHRKVMVRNEHITQYIESCRRVMPPAIAREQRRLYRLQAVAHTMASNAIKSGQLIRQPCEVCGNTRAHAHHDDYTKPLDVRWLCPKHHCRLHSEFRVARKTGATS